MKYGKQLTEDICRELELGMSREDVCTMKSINQDTFYDWMKKKSEFSESIKRAEMRCKERCIKIVQKAALGTWQAASWWLERKYRNEFSLRTELTGPGGKALAAIPVVVDKQDTKL